jgi:aminopeptidase N
MLDLHATAATPAVIHRADYQPPDWLVPEIALDFSLGAEMTRVHSTLSVIRQGAHHRPLRLEGDGLTPLAVRVDGEAFTGWRMEGGALILPLSGDVHQIEAEVEINPSANTQLMGLYASGGLLCTQCEAEGFRRITFFPDRPDVLSRYTVRMEADAATYPVLLSNGDLTSSGTLEGGRHWALWADPFPKPCYLFALVAGDLAANRDHFMTMSGKQVDLAIWVAEADVPRTAHAMQALKDAMAWDERVYGREYDLGQFNIVAVADFNFGAMENKSLNIFNSRYILADADTATDVDYDNVAGVVAHEYFHNWSGNRVTCRDWFQLSLKEGFTVFRDQCFSADHGSAPVKRIEDVRTLRAAQFPEDSGPLKHPIRPDSYIEIGNFYTATVYNKGAEVIRMLHTILGPKTFRAGSDLYFAQHDGQAVTCEDFILAMEEASGEDLSRFRRWYSSAGTPKIKAIVSQAEGETLVTLEQSLEGAEGPMAIPVKMALFDRETGAHSGERLEMMTERTCALRFPGSVKAPILSINRGFSAPVIVETKRSADELAFLAAHDDDPFGRYEAMQQLMVDTLVSAVATGRADHAPVIEAVRAMLGNNALEAALVAETVLLPSEAFVGDQMLVVDPDGIHAAREALRRDLGSQLEDHWRARFGTASGAPFIYSPEAKGARRIRNVALGYLAATGAADVGQLCERHYVSSDNMTDRMAAMGTLANTALPERETVLDRFYARYSADPLVIDKWFGTQALSVRADTLDAVRALSKHPDFTLHNPNRVRSLAGSFAANQVRFHGSGGGGYRFLADIVIELDPINPQTAAKLVPPLGRWKRFDVARQALMRAELERIIAAPGLSKDVFEQATKSLAG